MRKFKKIKVKTYSGYKYDEKPESFLYENRNFKVKRIIENHYEEDKQEKLFFNVFTVETDGMEEFKLYYDRESEEWFLKMKNKL